MTIEPADLQPLKPDALAPAAIEAKAEDLAVGKTQLPAAKCFVLAVMAGAFIAFGGMFFCTFLGDATLPFGVQRVVGGVCFCVGLVLILCCGAELFTGNALMVSAVIARKITMVQLLRNWALVYVGNFCGAVALAWLMAAFGQLDIGGGTLAVYTAKVAAAKCSLPWMNAFVLGIFCNLLVCIAIYLGNTAHDTAGKILGIFFPIMAFVVAGFEHCVANMYYIPAGIFAAANPAYAGMIADAGINVSMLDLGTFFGANLVPVTLGNIVGGAVVGVIMYATHATKKRS